MKATKMQKKSEVTRDWYIIDVDGKILGRVATEVATLLKGKHKVEYTPNVDSGSGVIVVNCDKIRVTGNKNRQKEYKRYSGYPNGQKVTTFEKMFEKDPKYVFRHAVKGMLPKNRLGAKMIKRLKLYTGSEHPHTAQNPKEKKV